MGGRKSQRESRFGLSRSKPTRKPLPVVVVVCDDAKTAPMYFECLKRELKTSITIKVVPSENGGTAQQVLNRAMNEKKKLSQGQEEKKQNSDDQVFALVDLEAEDHRKQQAMEAQKSGKAKGIDVALSNPCFEVWTLSHLVDTGRAFQNCKEVTKVVKKEWNATFNHDIDLKLEIDCQRLLQLRTNAIERAKKHHQQSQSWTEVYRVLEYIEDLCKRVVK